MRKISLFQYLRLFDISGFSASLSSKFNPSYFIKWCFHSTSIFTDLLEVISFTWQKSVLSTLLVNPLPFIYNNGFLCKMIRIHFCTPSVVENISTNQLNYNNVGFENGLTVWFTIKNEAICSQVELAILSYSHAHCVSSTTIIRL